MNDLDALRRFRAELPGPSDGSIARARAALLDEISRGGERPPTHRRAGVRLAWAAVLVGCTLLAVAVAATPPGRALAGDVGEFLGLSGSGRPGFTAVASEADLNHFSILSAKATVSELPPVLQRSLRELLTPEELEQVRAGRAVLPSGIQATVAGAPRAICVSEGLGRNESVDCSGVAEALTGTHPSALTCWAGHQTSRGFVRVRGLAPDSVNSVLVVAGETADGQTRIPVDSNLYEAELKIEPTTLAIPASGESARTEFPLALQKMAPSPDATCVN